MPENIFNEFSDSYNKEMSKIYNLNPINQKTIRFQLIKNQLYVFEFVKNDECSFNLKSQKPYNYKKWINENVCFIEKKIKVIDCNNINLLECNNKVYEQYYF